MDGFRGWEFLIQATVNSGGMIQLPEQVQESVATDHLTKGPAVHWSVENDNRYIVLSEKPLEKDAYTNVGIYKIYDIDGVGESGGRIRPPNEISSVWAADPSPGERVFYLTHRRMRSGAKSSVYLLSEDQILNLLPGQTNNPQANTITESLFEVPGFDSQE